MRSFISSIMGGKEEKGNETAGDIEVQVEDDEQTDEAPAEEAPAEEAHVRFSDRLPVVEENTELTETSVRSSSQAQDDDSFAEEVVVQQHNRWRNTSVISVIGGATGSVLPRMHDHFSLEMPSSAVRFRHAHIRIFEQANNQFILEETTKKDLDGRVNGTDVAVKYVDNSTTGLHILRAVYGLVSLFAGGFMFIFSLILLLFLFIDLSTQLQKDDSRTTRERAMAFIGVLLSVPVFVYGLSSIMAIVASFVKDTWCGHTFLRTFGNWKVVFTEWISFIAYLGVPLLTFIITLFARKAEWWQISLFTWFCSVLSIFLFFFIGVLFYDISACLYLIQHVDDPYFGPTDPGKFNLGLLRRAILLRQVDQWSGEMTKKYTLSGKLDTTDANFAQGAEARSESMGWYTRATRLNCSKRLFQECEPQRNYSLEDVLGNSPMYTAQSWALEKMFCRERKSGAITVINGPSALTPYQFKSSFVCAILGSLLIIIVPTALMVWLGLGPGVIVVVLAILVLCSIPTFVANRRTYKQYKELMARVERKKAEEEKRRAQYNDADERGKQLMNAHTRNRKSTARSQRQSVSSEAVYQVVETYRINRPRRSFCYIMFGVEVSILFVWPLIFLFASGNWQMGVFFVMIGLFSVVRHYLNASVVLKELGTFAELGSKNVFGVNLVRSKYMDTVMDKEWKAKSRLSAIVSNISRGRARTVFTWIFGVFALIALAIFLMVTREGGNTGPEENARNFYMSHDFYYPEKPNLPYPTCQMGKGLEIINSETALLDYAWISALSYANDDDTQGFLDDYFGEDVVKNNPQIIDDFKESPEYDYTNLAHYKYFTVTDNPSFGLVAVRGTSAKADYFADGQLWGAAVLFQILRLFLPVGEAFTPILHQVIMFVTTIETKNIEKVAYYKEISGFIRYLEDYRNVTDIHVTGHSLGGGLALISGAQTKHIAIGLSAPNAMLSRGTFDPPITPDDLNNFTFNIIPNRDPVARMDDVADLYQRIECTAAPANFFSCHLAGRSMCEIMNTCGTNNRPAFCLCTETYKYPEPLPKDGANMTWSEFCKAFHEKKV